MIGSTTWKNYPSIRFAVLMILLATLAVVSGCSSAKIIQESVVVRDTVVVTKERKLVDTLTLFKDTTIYQDRVKVKIEYRDNYVKIEADCPSDTIRIETIKIQTAKSRDKKMGWEGFAGWVVATLALLVVIKSVVNKLI
jgi:hypothetical protein